MRKILIVACAALTLPGLTLCQLGESEKTLIAKLDTSRVVSDLQRFSTGLIKTKSGLGAGSAVVGSPEERLLADAVEAEMKKLGLKTHQEKFPVRAYSYGEVTLTANGKPIPAVSLHAAGGTWGMRDGVPYARGNDPTHHRVRALLFNAGDGFASDYAAASSVAGKVVLVRRTQGWPVNQILEAAHRGAAALVMYDYPQAPETTVKQDSMWYHEQLPVVSISKAQAKRLVADMREKPVEIVLDNRIDSGDGLSQNVIGIIAGTEFPDQWVIVSAHYDRRWQSAQDNCVSVAMMLEIARVLTSSGYRPRRSVMFLSTGGEEAGVEATEQDWLAGSWAFTQAHPEILRRLVYDFNLDVSGWTSKRGILNVTPDAVPSQTTLIGNLGLADRITVRPGLGNTTDAWALGTVGGGASAILRWTGVFTGSDNSDAEPDPFARYYDTQEDVYRQENYGNLPDHLKFTLASVLRADRALLAPVDFTAVAGWARQALDTDAAKVRDVSFDNARGALKNFESAAERVKSASARVTTPGQAGPFSLWLMRTRKDLMPWLFGQGQGSLRTAGYANTLAALTAARLAAEMGDKNAALEALARVNNARNSMRFSPEVAREERLYWYSSGDWSSAFYQKQRPVDESLDMIYRRVAGGGDIAVELPGIRQAEGQVRGYLNEALFLIEGNCVRPRRRSTKPHSHEVSGHPDIVCGGVSSPTISVTARAY